MLIKYMAYASLKEVWGNDFNLYKEQMASIQKQKEIEEYKKEQEQFNQTKIEPFNNIILDKSYTAEVDDVDEDYEEITCDQIIGHVLNCEYCKSKLIQQHPLHLPDHVLNTLLFIIGGIFILFLLDIFVRLGKSLS